MINQPHTERYLQKLAIIKQFEQYTDECHTAIRNLEKLVIAAIVDCACDKCMCADD